MSHPVASHLARRLHTLHADGWVTFLLANLVMVLTLGLTALLCGLRVVAMARRTPAGCAGADAVLVPGMRLVHGQIHADFAARLRRSRQLALASDRPILLLGGLPGPGHMSEAAAGRAALLAQGVDPAQIWVEEQSRNTLENLRAAREICRAQDWHSVAIVTNRYHLARVHTFAQGLGLNHSPCAAEDRLALNAATVGRMMFEAYYLHWYHVGKIWSRLTGNRASLARIS